MSGIERAVHRIAWVPGGARWGPATLAVSGTAMGHGRPLPVALASGMVLGFAILGVAAGLGLGARMTAEAWVFVALCPVGAGYILWLAIRSLRSAAHPRPLSRERGLTVPRTGRASVAGALSHLTNPTAILSGGVAPALLASWPA